IGVYLDDPTSVPEAELRSQACVVVDEPMTVEAPLLSTHIQGGDHAVLKYKGPYGDMRAAYDWLFGRWLPSSGREAADDRSSRIISTARATRCQPSCGRTSTYR
ncbi:MAG: GyrI-like domain-containing protein, partial [Microvirga sp.]